MPQAIPPLLTPYVEIPPKDSLSLVTSVLGATGNWLVLRFLYNALNPLQQSRIEQAGVDKDENNFRKLEDQIEQGMPVAFVSFIRSFEFWNAEARRLGIDLVRLCRKKKFVFVDALTNLFQTTGMNMHSPPCAQEQELGVVRARWNGLKDIEEQIMGAINSLKAVSQEPILLIIDQLDFLLAATGNDISGSDMEDLIFNLREHAHSVILTLAADSPLIHTYPTSTPLEMSHAAFLVAVAHQARLLLQLRELETGIAKDVSGALRICYGPATLFNGDEGTRSELQDKEVLYEIQNDGSLRVFERGS